MAGKNAGRTGHRMRVIKRQLRQTETHCFRCGQRIDWSIAYWISEVGGEINLDAGTVEHKLPRSTHPHLAEDPGNLAASHARCNFAAGDRVGQLGLGLRTRQW